MIKKLAFLLGMTGLLIGCAVDTPPNSADEKEPALANWSGRIVDLSYAFDAETIFWPTAAGFEITTDFEGITENGFYYSAYSFSTAEHGGTHLDAPIHFSEGGFTNDEIPLDRLIGPAIVVDVSVQAAENPDYLVTVSDFQRWEENNGPIPDGIIIIVRTGFGAYWPDREKYLGTAELGEGAIPKLHFPGLDPAAASWLVSERNIHAIGLDTASIDRGQSSLYESHQILFAANIPAFENVANVDVLPVKDFTIVALPMKISNGSGGPLRIVAVLP